MESAPGPEQSKHALDGLVVVERAGRLAAAVAGTLLAELGARVIRVEGSQLEESPEPPLWRTHPLATAGKTRLVVPADDTETWRGLIDRADAVILPDAAMVGDGPDGPVFCAVSAYGMANAVDSPDAGEIALQATGGLMATTGEAGGAPEWTGIPLIECFTGLNAATAILAALRVRAAGGPAQRIDIAGLDAGLALLGTFVGDVLRGKTKGYRVGCRHPLIAPWNAYPTRNGQVLICSSTEGHWRRILDLIGRPDLLDDPRFTDAPSRIRNVDAVDDAIRAWTATRDSGEVVRAMEAADVPAGPILSIPDLLAGSADGPPLPTRRVRMPDGAALVCPQSMLRMTRTPGVAPAVVATPSDAESVLRDLPPQHRTATGPARMPLDGIRVVEVGAFTAGPLGGRYLADLGAEVIKIEPPGGEGSRRWHPQFGGVSGYFATYNAGKRSVTLDLGTPEGRSALDRLLARSDVLLQNLKAGAMDRLGFGAADVLRRFPRLVYCSISGYGSDGPLVPALDTVIQATSGVLSLTGSGAATVKIGVSAADLLVAHISPLTILAALRYRDRTGEGQHIDLSMRDCLSWTTQLAWPDGKAALPHCRRVACADGYVVVEGEEEAIPDRAITGLARDAAVARLRDAGCRAVAVLELDEVVGHPLVRKRRLVEQLPTDGKAVPVLAAPYRLMTTPPRPGRPMGPAGADDDLLVDAPDRAETGGG